MSTIQTSSYTDPTKLGLNNGAQKSTTTGGSSSSGTLDKDGFLKLFVAQLQHQDPSSPMDTTQSMEQMASFSMVEQITNMASQNTQIAKTLATSSAVGLIGRTVTYLDSSGQAQTGKVEQRRHEQGRRVLAHRRRQDRRRPCVHLHRRLIRRLRRSLIPHDARNVRRDQRPQAAPDDARRDRE